jgi:hypothetical protein
MDIFFQDPNEVRLPPEQVRLLESCITPLGGGNRIKIFLELTPFMKRPNIEITIINSSGKILAHSSILETMLRKLEFIMHLRGSEPGSEYKLEAIVYYQKLPEPSDVQMDLPLPDPMIVDHHSKMFMIPQSQPRV